jgi:hypothetical protein
MPTAGAFEFKLAPAAGPGGVIVDENGIAKGEWAWLDREPKGASRRWLAVYLRCPDCGILATLWRSYGDDKHGHQIDAQGNISPSVGCPHSPCGFHTQPTKLVGFIDRR